MTILYADHTIPCFRHATPASRTFCGPDALAALPGQLDRPGLNRAVIFCGQSRSRRYHEALARIESALGDRLAARFDRVEPHSPLPCVTAAARPLAEAQADTVIAVGGGSAIVTARAVTIILAEKHDIRELCTRREADGRLTSPRLGEPKLPQWVVPTAPTTACAKAGSPVRDPDTGERLALFDPKTRAPGFFIDPLLMLTAPAALAQRAALNAFAVAIEGVQAAAGDPLAEASLTPALGIACRWLPRLGAAPGEPEPRVWLILAALLSGQGSDYTGGGLAQALAHAAGPRSSAPNGVIEALLLPHTMRYNAPVTAERLARIAEILAAAAPAGTSGDGNAVTRVERLLRSTGVPARLRDAGVARDSLSQIAAHTLDDWTLTRVPRPAGRHHLEELLHAAW